MYEKLNYQGWPNCIRLFNQEIELIVTTDIGPRIVHFGFINQQNFLYLIPETLGKSGVEKYQLFGGHRLWLAPESIPFSYNPDNEPVVFELNANGIVLKQQKEETSGIFKEMEITLSAEKNEVKILHRVKNGNKNDVELAIWPISMMATGGTAIVPHEPFGEGDEFLLPARPLALWSYTKMNDPRWVWGEKYIQAIQDPEHKSEQKIGILNKQKWAAYYLNGQVLIKKFDYHSEANYPDFGCNNELYVCENYLEIETLSPLKKIKSGEAIEHIEYWKLAKASFNGSEKSIDENILPLVTSFKPKTI